MHLKIEGLVQDRHKFSALAMELRLSCTNPSNVIIKKSSIFSGLNVSS